MSVLAWTYLFVGVTFTLYLAIAWVSRVKDTRGFYVAGRGVPAIANGMATGADWMSAASYISMAGLISTMGYAGGVYLMGWTGGYVLLALLLAPYLRKFGHFTVPDFVGDRYESGVARVVAAVCAIFISFTYVAGQMKGVGVVFSRFLDVDVSTGVILGMVIVFAYAVLGGMKGITWTQVAQYWVLITAFLVPAIAISIQLTGNPVPQLGMGGRIAASVDPTRPFLLEKLNQLNTDLGFASYTSPFTGKWDMPNVFCVALALMVGTAGLPHVIVRFYTVKSVRAARWSAFWALFFIALLYLTAPAVASFARYYMIDPVAGLNGKTADTLPPWFNNWKRSGLIEWVDLNRDGRLQWTNNNTATAANGLPANELWHIDGLPADARKQVTVDPAAWVASHGANAYADLTALGGRPQPDNDIIVLATPEMANLANWMVALVAAGGLAAALSTASGLLLVISSSIAHDLYARMINPQASEAKRLLVGRAVIGVAVIVAGIFGIYPPGFVGQVVAFAFGLAAASFFPALVLGIFSKRVGTVPAVSGMIAGIGFTGFYIVAVIYGGMAPWTFGLFPTGINPQGIGTVGMVLNFAVTLSLTPFTRGPSEATKALIDSVRDPEEPALTEAAEPGLAH